MIYKWYEKLSFPKEFDKEFSKLIKKPESEYGRNLLYLLEKCEDAYISFQKRGIPEGVFTACAQEIVDEVVECYNAYNVFGVEELEWLEHVIVKQKIFRIGRLNYGMDIAGDWCNGADVKHGDKILLVHIPKGESLTREECLKSLDEAEKFFETYYPEFEFKCFVCSSWLMYPGLKEFLKEKSGIKDFMELFKVYRTDESDSLIRFVFGRNVTRDNILNFKPVTSLQVKIKAHILDGGILYRSCAIRKRKDMVPE